jgi:hypothetical protein
MTQHLLGTGLLSWPRNERMAGRYGLVALFRPGDTEKGEEGLQGVPFNTNPGVEMLGTHGALIAVLDSQELSLGEGTLFTEHHHGMDYIGLRPDEPREEDWLNVPNLYKVDGYLIHRPIDLYFQTGD